MPDLPTKWDVERMSNNRHLQVPFAVVQVAARPAPNWDTALGYSTPANRPADNQQETDDRFDVERRLSQIGFTQLVRVLGFYASRAQERHTYCSGNNMLSGAFEPSEYVFDFGLTDGPENTGLSNQGAAWLHALLANGASQRLEIPVIPLTVDQSAGNASESVENRLVIFSAEGNESVRAFRDLLALRYTPAFLTCDAVSLGLMVGGVNYVTRNHELTGDPTETRASNADYRNYRLYPCPLVEIPGVHWNWVAHGTNLGQAILASYDFEQNLAVVSDTVRPWPHSEIPEHPRDWRTRDLGAEMPVYRGEPDRDYESRSKSNHEATELLRHERWIYWTWAAMSVRSNTASESCWTWDQIRAALGIRAWQDGRAERTLRDRANTYGEWANLPSPAMSPQQRCRARA